MPDAHSLLENDLDSLNNWSQDWAMEFDPTKCKVLHISKKQSPTRADNRNYSIVSSITDLVITVCSDLSWARHIEDTVARELRVSMGLTVNRQKRNIFTVNRQMSKPILASRISLIKN